MTYGNTLSNIRERKTANAAVTTLLAFGMQAAVSNAYAGDAQPKAKAPLEERLDKAPKMDPPEGLKLHTPKTPGPFSVIDVTPNPTPVDGKYDANNRTFNGKVKIYGQEADISLLVGPREADQHAMSVKIGKTPLEKLNINKAGEDVYIDWEQNIGAFAYEIDGKEFMVAFSYMERDGQGKSLGDSRRIDLAYELFVLTDEDKVPESVREKGAKGKLILHVSREDGVAITCNFVHTDVIGDTSRPDPAVYCRDARLENNLDKLLAQQNDDVKRYVADVKSEVNKMLKTGAQKEAILGYIELMTAEVKRRLALDIDALSKRQPAVDIMQPGIGMPTLLAVGLLEEKLVAYVDANYVEDIVEEPAPELEKPELPNDAVASGQQDGSDEDEMLPIMPLVDLKPEEKPEDKTPEEKPLEIQVKETPIHPAVDFTQKVPPKEEVEKEDSFWTSPLAITMYVVGGLLVAGGIGTGIYFGTRDNGGPGPDPQPPVGNPVMGPGDKW